MNFTFGIITDGANNDRVNRVVDSILAADPIGAFDKNWDVVIVGGVNATVNCGKLQWITFDESVKPGWITKKKNLITEFARKENIVYMHDYVAIEPGWFEGFERFGDDWDVAMTRVLNADGSRFRDWCFWDHPAHGHKWTCREPWCPEGIEFEGTAHPAPYEETDTSRHYVSGTYWIAKRDFMLKYPLDERLGHCMGEDVCASLEWRKHWNYKMNIHSSVRLLKQK